MTMKKMDIQLTRRIHTPLTPSSFGLNNSRKMGHGHILYKSVKHLHRHWFRGDVLASPKILGIMKMNP